MQEAVRAE